MLAIHEMLSHILQPIRRSGHTVGIGQQNQFVFGFFDTDSQRKFLAFDRCNRRVQIHKHQVGILLLVVLHHLGGLVVRVVADHDDLVIVVLLGKQCRQSSA